MKRIQPKTAVVRAIQYTVLSLAVLYIVFPLYFLFLSSVKSDNEIFLRPFALPRNWLIQNYVQVWVNDAFYKYMFNSFYYAVFSVLLSLTASTFAAYAITRMIWKGSGKVLALLLTGMMIPIHSVILPLYISSRAIGIQNPKIIVVCIFAAFALPKSIFIISGFLKDVPRALEEAAAIDGAGIYRILLQIILPLLKPAVAVVCIFDFIAVWNDLLVGMIFITKNSDKTLQLGIMRYIGDYVTIYNMVFAAVLISVMPMLILFSLFQKQIVAGITMGAVKG